MFVFGFLNGALKGFCKGHKSLHGTFFEMPWGGGVMKIYVNFHLAIGLFNLIAFIIFQLTLINILTIFSTFLTVAPWCSGYHYCTTSFNKAWTQVLCWLKSCSQHVGDLRWWGTLTMVQAGNKAKHLSSVNHSTKAIHHHHVLHV